MNKLITIIFLLAPGIAFAHPGHITEEQAHGFLHGEHLILLLALVAVFVVNRLIKKLF